MVITDVACEMQVYKNTTTIHHSSPTTVVVLVAILEGQVDLGWPPMTTFSDLSQWEMIDDDVVPRPDKIQERVPPSRR